MNAHFYLTPGERIQYLDENNSPVGEPVEIVEEVKVTILDLNEDGPVGDLVRFNDGRLARTC